MGLLSVEGRYLEGALRLLQHVELRRPTGRRFGADADARWGGFGGDLVTADRIELLIRDADAEWPGALGARTVYALRGVAEDEPFGPRWSGLDPVDAEELWRHVTRSPAPATLAETLRAIAAAWDVTLEPHDAGAIEPTDRLIVAGPSAMAATIAAFAARQGLDWADQVTAIATPPAHRQLAAAATALLNSPRAARVLASDEMGAAPRGARLVVSADADPADAAAASALLER